MLRRPDGLVIGQPAHAWVSGQLARAWGNDAFPAPAPREPVCLAAEQHDVGWAEADLSPLAEAVLPPDAEATYRPIAFLDYPRPGHVAIWRGAARRMLAQSRYAALLVSLHGTSLYEHFDAGTVDAEVGAAVLAYLQAERAQQAELARGLDPVEVDVNRRLLLAWDRMSLALCFGRAGEVADVPGIGGAATPMTLTPLERAPGDGSGVVHDDAAVPADVPAAEVAVAPWPFAADAVVVGLEARRLDGPFADAGALQAALAAAPWVPLRWRLSPG